MEFVLVAMTFSTLFSFAPTQGQKGDWKHTEGDWKHTRDQSAALGSSEQPHQMTSTPSCAVGLPGRWPGTFRAEPQLRTRKDPRFASQNEDLRDFGDILQMLGAHRCLDMLKKLHPGKLSMFRILLYIQVIIYIYIYLRNYGW